MSMPLRVADVYVGLTSMVEAGKTHVEVIRLPEPAHPCRFLARVTRDGDVSFQLINVDQLAGYSQLDS